MGLSIDVTTAQNSVALNTVWESECSLEDAIQFSKGRRTFSTLQGKNCLGPCETRPADLVVVLMGGKVPYVLREAEDVYVVDSTGVKLYRLIGEW